MKRRASRPLQPTLPLGGRGPCAPVPGAPQGVLLAVPTVAALQDAELVLPPDTDGRREGAHLALVGGEGARQAPGPGGE